MKFARGTPWRFILPQLAAAPLLLFVGAGLAVAGGGPGPSPPALLFLIVGALACVWAAVLVLFFRDPERTPGAGVVAPADGRLREARSTGEGAAVSIFLGLQNVHVVRAPIAGKVTALAYKPGGRRFAFSKDSHLNERLVMRLTGEGESCSLTLIAGAFADRILPYVEPGAQVMKGERVGVIKFGSRVDADFAFARPHALVVEVGDTVIAGRTSILAPPGGG